MKIDEPGAKPPPRLLKGTPANEAGGLKCAGREAFLRGRPLALVLLTPLAETKALIRNGLEIAQGSVVSTQVCVVGSGPAGLTAAWYLSRAGVAVTVIDGGPDAGGGFQPSWKDKRFFYAGQVEGLLASNESDFLTRPIKPSDDAPWERERVLGGTSTHWGGQCRPLDAATFEPRPGIPGGTGFPGWPICREELDPYYSEAASFCNLAGDDFSAEHWAKLLDAQVPQLAGVDTEIYQFVNVATRNFATRRYDGLPLAATAIDLIVNANLLGIDTYGYRATRLAVASTRPTYSGAPPQKATEFTIEADFYILACGAVANARQLLLSEVGNEHDLVGRYFTGHPISRAPVAFADQPFLSAAENKLMRGGNFNHEGVTVQGRFVPQEALAKRLGIGRGWLGPWTNSNLGSYAYFEAWPNLRNRVYLAESLDPVFRQRQTAIVWNLGDQDRSTWDQGCTLYQEALAQRGRQLSFETFGQILPQLVVNGHHLGTTRMADHPGDGVVDRNLKIHSLENLFVAGSSVFPSAGSANPTFTIIALSIRLAEHLQSLLGASPASRSQK